jgi:hypothetical protein
MARLNWSRIGLHVVFWLVYIIINGIMASIIQGQPLPENMSKAMVGELFSLPPKITLVYFIFYYIIPL